MNPKTTTSINKAKNDKNKNMPIKKDIKREQAPTTTTTKIKLNKTKKDLNVNVNVKVQDPKLNSSENQRESDSNTDKLTSDSISISKSKIGLNEKREKKDELYSSHGNVEENKGDSTKNETKDKLDCSENN